MNRGEVETVRGCSGYSTSCAGACADLGLLLVNPETWHAVIKVVSQSNALVRNRNRLA